MRAIDDFLRAHPRAPLTAAAAVLAVVLLAALVPMFAICPFDHSYADDWHYGVDAHLALQAGGGALDAVSAALAEVRDTYFSWQGTYSAIFLMALQPGVLGEAAYGAGAAAVIAALLLATAYATGVVVREVLGADRATWVALTCLVLLLQTQLLPSPVEGFWWYNAAVYYTFYHALMLVMAGLAVRLVRGSTRRGPLSRAGAVARSALLALLAFVVAGGNFVTGVVACLALAAGCAGALLRRPRRAARLVPALLVLAVGFAVSMAAPGNAERQISQFSDDGLGAIETIAASVLAGFEYTVLWANGYLALALAAALPFMVRAARRARWSFARPLVPAACSLALFMASFTPTFYSMGYVGPGRVQNIRYDLFVLLVFACAQWAVGRAVRLVEAYASRGEGARAGDALGPSTRAGTPGRSVPRPAGKRFRGAGAAPSRALTSAGAPVLGDAVPCADAAPAPPAAAVPARPRPVEPPAGSAPPCPPAAARALAVYLLACLAVLAGSVGALALDARHADDLVSVSAARSLLDGEAAEYDAQVRERIDAIESSPDADVLVPFYTVGPKVLFMGDIRDNMDTYINYRLSQWYGKDSIIGYHAALDAG